MHLYKKTLEVSLYYHASITGKAATASAESARDFYARERAFDTVLLLSKTDDTYPFLQHEVSC